MSKDADPNRKWADKYDLESRKSQWHGPGIMFGILYPHIKVGENLLDLGIGTGLSALPFHKAGLKVHGIDNSPAMLEQCKKKGLPIKVNCHSLNDIPWSFENSGFHYVISTGVFHFLGELKDIVRETARVIKKGGLFGFDFYEYNPDENDKYRKIKEGIYTHIDNEYQVQLYRHTEQYINKILSDAGFHILHDIEFLISKNPKKYFKLLISEL